MTAGTDWTEGSKTDQNLRQKLQRLQQDSETLQDSSKYLARLISYARTASWH